MGSIAFRFNKPVSFNYAAGPAQSGKDGDTGKQGVAGTAIYFTDYELDNSYSIELALQRIENNYVLSGNSNTIITGRSYKAGDLILSNKANCYRIIENTNTNSDFHFDIEYLGKIQRTDTTGSSAVISVYIYDITGMKIYDRSNNLLADYSSKITGVTANNRRYCSSTNINITRIMTVSPDSSCFELYGRWYKCFVILNSKNPDNRYSVKLDLPDYKSYVFNSYNNTNEISVSDPNLYNSVTRINKSIEFLDCGFNYTGASEDDRITYLFKEITYNGLNDASIGAPTSYISDMSADRLKHENNGIKCTFAGNKFISNFDNKLLFDTSTNKKNYIHPDLPFNESETGVLADLNIFDYTSSEHVNSRPGETAVFSAVDPNNGEFKPLHNLFDNYELSVICSNNVTGAMQILTDVETYLDKTYINTTYKATVDYTNHKIIDFNKQ